MTKEPDSIFLRVFANFKMRLKVIFTLIIFYLAAFFPISLEAQDVKPENESILDELSTLIDFWEVKDPEKTIPLIRKIIHRAERTDDIFMKLLGLTAGEYYANQYDLKELESLLSETESYLTILEEKGAFLKYKDFFFEHTIISIENKLNEGKYLSAETLCFETIKKINSLSPGDDSRQFYEIIFAIIQADLKNQLFKHTEEIKILSGAQKKVTPGSSNDLLVSSRLADYYFKTDEQEKAIEYAERAYAVSRGLKDTEPEGPQNFLDSGTKLCQLYLEYDQHSEIPSIIKELDKSTVYIEYSKSAFDLLRGRYYAVLGATSDSETIIDSVIERRGKAENRLYGKLAEALYYKTLVFEQQNKTKDALEICEEGIKTLMPSVVQNDKFTKSHLSSLCYDKSLLLDFLVKKSALYLKTYKTNKQKQILIQALDYTEYVLELLRVIRNDLQYVFDKENLQRISHENSASILQIVSTIHSIEPSLKSRVEKIASGTMEASRSLLLAEAYERAEILLKNKENKELLEKVYDIRAKIAAIYKRADRQGLNAAELDSLNELQNEYYQIVGNQNESIDIQLVDLEVILRKEQQTLLQYFTGPHQLYIYANNGSVSDLIVRPLPEDFNSITETFIAGVSDEKGEVGDIPFLNSAHTLFNLLIPENFPLQKRLLIMPEGILNYIPFDALLTELPPEEKTFKFPEHSYLIKKHTISYDYSGRMFIAQKRGQIEQINFKGFAPEYVMNVQKVRSRNFGPLNFNKEEVKTINELFAGEIFTGEAANISNFEKTDFTNAYLHFAGHAVLEPDDAASAYLVFSSTDSVNRQILPMNAVYTKNIPAEMVVLSACKTGTGEMHRGEGVFSIGRAFTHAGTRSIMSTLWSVNDETTKQIMLRFYNNLNKGMRKDEALREAKLHYIEDLVVLYKSARPFYWAGFTPYGNMQAQSSSVSPVRWLSGGLILLILLWYSRERKKIKNLEAV